MEKENWEEEFDKMVFPKARYICLTPMDNMPFLQIPKTKLAWLKCFIYEKIIFETKIKERNRIKNLIIAKYYTQIQGDEDEYAHDLFNNQLIELIIDDIYSEEAPQKEVEPSDDELPF